jgi:catalase
MPFGLFEQERWPSRTQHAVGDLGHFEFRINLDMDSFKFAELFELADEVA